MRELLVPVDFSGPSQRACDLAVELADKLGAGLVLLRVVEPLPAYMVEGAPSEEATRQEIEALTHRADALRPRVSSLETLLVSGSPWEEIERVATERKVELVVMGTHGRHGLARAVLGSVAERVVRTARCPVLTVPGWTFTSRTAAAEGLARELLRFRPSSPMVVALSRGAVPIATELARRLDGSSDVWLVRPVVLGGAVVGAVTEQGDAVFDAAPAPGTEDDRRVAVLEAQGALAEELRTLRGGRSIGDVWHRDLVLVDEGAISPAPVIAAARSLRAYEPKRILAALPIAHVDAIAPIRGQVDALVHLESMVVRDDPSAWFRDDQAPSPADARDALARDASARSP